MIMRTYSKDLGSTGTGLWGNGTRLLPALLHFALMPFRKAIAYTPALLHSCILISLLASCSSDDAPEPAAGPEPTATVQLYLSVPGAAATRIGDPGSPTGEGIDWDELAVMLEYVSNSDGIALPAHKRLVRTITKEEFLRLPSLDAEGRVKLLSLDVQPGDVHIYGVTYSRGIAVKNGDDLGDVIAQWAAGSNGVASLTIPNSYAEGDANRDAKFLSVATGYYADATGGLGTYAIRFNFDGEPGQARPTMTLTRLAAKIDIQWDAADAYPAYSDVAVKGFTFHGEGNTGGSQMVSGPGSGRLFPTLVAEDSEQLGGQSTFLNTSEISRRNGRVYHYVFPDGVGIPRVTFGISAYDENSQRVEKNYTFTFPSALSKATWYKVNTTIRGLNGENTTFQLENWQTGD